MPDLLAIHTGGTIGMAAGPQGYAPAPGLVEEALQRLARSGARVRAVAFDPLVDSADIGPDHWNRMIDLIAASPAKGVVVTHGTDTMSFTGAALSQALAGIGVPVVLTGAMHPLGAGDAAESNLTLALEAASGAVGKGVWLAFAGRVFPAGGLVKHDSAAADSFRSVAVPAGDGAAGPFRPRRFASRRLAVLSLSPGMGAEVLRAALSVLDGAVLRVFGSGTMMNDGAVAATLAAATARGCRIVAVSQCENGGLAPGAYAAGAALWRAGVENGGALTPEAAFARLWLDLSLPEGPALVS